MLNEKHHAFLVAQYYRILHDLDPAGAQAVFLFCTRKYAEERGARMAQRALRDGRELTLGTYMSYGEWEYTDPSFSESEVLESAPDHHYLVHKCPWNTQFSEMGVAILHLVRPFHQFHQIDRNQYGSHDTEKRQEQFSKNLQTKSHTVVFRKIDIKPVSHMNILMQIHVRLHRNLDKLVDNQYSCHHKSNQTSLSEKFFHLLQFANWIQKN